MKMPASFAEFSDALQKARIKDGSFCKNELTCIHYNGLTHAMIGWNANLYDLNLFAQRLASLTEEQKKGMDALLKIKQNHRVAPIPLNQLINLTYNTDICCFAPRVSNHEELGAFLYANEMLSNEAMALLDTTEEGSGFQERLLELLGEQHQEDHGGVFTDFGYAELGGEIKDIYVCQSNETACFHRSDAPVVLEVRKGFFNDPSYSYASGLTSFGSQPHDMRSNFPLIEQAHRRLAKVVIENKDFEKLLRQYDRPVSFFYLDPPYHATEGYYQNIGEDGFTEADHIRLRDALMRIEGKFLLSYNDDAFVRGLYDRPGIYLMETTRINNIKQRYDNGAQFPELLIANYDLRERSRAVPSQMTLFDWNGG